MSKSREKGELMCLYCGVQISVEEFNGNGGYCDGCRDGRNDNIVGDAIKSDKEWPTHHDVRNYTHLRKNGN